MAFQKRIVAVVIIMLLAVSFGAAAPRAHAESYQGTVDLTCTDFTAAGTGADVLDRDNTGAGQEKVQILVTDGAGTVLYELTFQNGLGSYAAGLINTTLYVTAPKFNPIVFKVTSLAGNGLPEEVEELVTGECAGLPGLPYEAVPVPVGFTLHTLVCDTAVFNEPAGTPVGDNVVTAGQTWYTNPTPVAAVNGESWTEIFVAGVHTGFVPTRCVQ
jgi:hypothetical protein